MSSFNRVIMVGYLGSDPTVKEFDNKSKVADLRLATNESFSKNGVQTEITHWHDVVAWRGLADFSEKFLKKGRKILVEGKLRTSVWDDKEGEKRKTTFILADTIRFMDKKESTDGTITHRLAVESATEDVDEDDLPF